MTESSELGSGCGYQQPNPQAPDVSVLSPLRASTPMNLKKKKKKASALIQETKGKGGYRERQVLSPHFITPGSQEFWRRLLQGWSETLSRNVVVWGDGMWEPGARKAPPLGRG